MPGQAYLGIDLGAESGRAILGSYESDRLSLHELHRFPNTKHRLSSGLHWNILGLWQNVLDGLRKAVAWSKEHDVELVSVGVDTWGVDFGLIGRSGELLGMPHCYRDERNLPAFDWAIEELGRERIYEATGIQFMALNTLYQLIARQRDEPALLESADKLLFMPDLMHYFLSGRPVVESTIASTSQMIDTRTGKWAVDLIQDAGLPTHFLSPTIPAGSEFGLVLNEVAAETDASSSLRVITPAAHDTGSAVVAVPADERTNWCYLSSGTWTPVGAELARPCITSRSCDVSYTNEGGLCGTTRFLKNVTGLWLVQECRREFEKQSQAFNYDRLSQMARDATPFRTLIDPDHQPFLLPGQVPEKIREFARMSNQPEPESVGQIIRCCLESLALSYRYTLGLMESVLDQTFEIVHIVGGGGRNDLLNHMTADATNRVVVVGPYEATATGNIVGQMFGAGVFSGLKEIREVVRRSFEPVRIEPNHSAEWDDAFARFLALRDAD
jgi:rhamnulokinase